MCEESLCEESRWKRLQCTPVLFMPLREEPCWNSLATSTAACASPGMCPKILDLTDDPAATWVPTANNQHFGSAQSAAHPGSCNLSSPVDESPEPVHREPPRVYFNLHVSEHMKLPSSSSLRRPAVPCFVPTTDSARLYPTQNVVSLILEALKRPGDTEVGRQHDVCFPLESPST